MRKIIALLTVLLLCAALVCPASAAGSTFVPSISYKDGPDIDQATLPGEPVDSCMVITSITDAKENTTDIHQEDRDLLLEIYQKLSEGSMKLPLEGKYVVRELVDVSFKENACVGQEHPHEEELGKKGVLATVTFDLGLPKNAKIYVLTYVDGKWINEKAVNNGNGTVTVNFEDIGPVAFCVDPADTEEVPKTGDEARQSLILWITLLVVCAIAIPVLLVLRKKSAKKHN